MVYQWKIPGVMPVDAQTAGSELSRIYKEKGSLDPADIVNESREENAPLHPCFEWDDATAAEKYRENQAANIVRLIVVHDEKEDKQQAVRAFVHVAESYRPIQVAVNNNEMMQELLLSAMRELDAFRRKYNVLSQLAPVFNAIEKVST